jgi:hypothetical protein
MPYGTGRCIILVTLLASAAASNSFAAVSSQDAGSAAAGADESWRTTIAGDLARQEYAATHGDLGLQAPNRAHSLRTRFGSEGIAVGPRVESAASDWQFAWRTTALGRPEHMIPAAPAVPECHGFRVEYRRPGWSEWYENTPEGLEQGFTLDRRPPGDGPLRIAGALSPELSPELQAGEVDFFAAGGAHVLHYGKLVTFDAHGREVPSRIELAENALVIEVDDRNATYPLTIDPILTSPSWIGGSNQFNAEFGMAAATAGDVNGDGFSDVIIGAHLYDNGQEDEGRAYLFLGSASGLQTSAAWIVESNQAGAELGSSVAAAGDVNGDGFGDVIVGALYYTNVEASAGRALVYHGSASGLSATPAWIVDGDQNSGVFGYDVAGAGDVNGDGFSDVIVGCPWYDNPTSQSGKAYVFHGSASGLTTVPAWINGTSQAEAHYGQSVASAGDVNGDGYADVIIGAAGDWDEPSEGRAFVYLGSASGLSGFPSWTADGNQAHALFGWSVGTAGDTNGDGFADVIVGSPQYDRDTAGDNAGRAFVYYGSAAGVSSSPAWVADCFQTFAWFGISVGTAGDVNGDGFADIMVGAPFYDNGQEDEGGAFVYPGFAAGIATTPIWVGETNQIEGGYFDWSFPVGTAGDVNGDGFSDVLFGAGRFDSDQSDEGRAWVHHGGPDGLGTFATWSTSGGQALAFWGWAVGSAGDVNGDGYSDVYAVASNFDNGQADEGKVWVYHGGPAGASQNPAWSGETNQVAAEIASAACAGDVNGDGYSDFIFGSYRFDGGQNDEGRTWLHLGSPSGLSPFASWTSEPDQASAWFGVSVASAGDVNGDGFGDVIVGADGWDNGQSSEGRAWLYLGSSGGLGGPAWSIEGEQEGASLGYTVGTAGDVNGDGFSDVLIGLPQYDRGQLNEGVVWVFHGSDAGLPGSPTRVLEANHPDASFGSAVASAGDVNGDAYSDVIIGSDQYDGGQTNEGRAYVFHGGPSGLAAAFAWSTESDQANAQLGRAVSTAGDLNGDGYSDVVVGAPRYDTVGVDDGRIWVYQGSPTGLGAPVRSIWVGQAGALFGFGVGTAGDVNGDGFSDVIFGAPGYNVAFNDDGGVWIFVGNQGGGLPRIRRQMRTTELVPIDVLGRSDSESGFRLQGLARTPAGRAKVRLQIEAKPAGVPFDGTGLLSTPYVLTGAPTGGGSTASVLHLVSELAPGTVYHWRMRIASDSPLFPRSPWLWQPMNAMNEGDVRTGGTANGVAEDAAPPAQVGLALEPASPNPFSDLTEVAFTLGERAAADLGVYDVQGRRVAKLAEGPHAAGRHAVRWNGRDPNGRRLPAGVYFVRLELRGQVVSQKLVLSR